MKKPKIDRAKPLLYKSRKAASVLTEVFNEMLIHDSIFVKHKDYREYQAILSQYMKYRPERKWFWTREGKGHRLWRTK